MTYNPTELTPMGFQQITDLSLATALTVPAGAMIAVIQAQGMSIRIRDDGINPTASVGSIIPANETEVYTGPLSAIKLIEAAASAVANVRYYR